MHMPIRIGIIGCGRVTFGTYGSTLKYLRGQRLIDIVAACDVQEEKRQAVLDEFNVRRCWMNLASTPSPPITRNW